MHNEVRIRGGLLAELRALAQVDPARECCGLLAGRGRVILEILPAANALKSATAYEIAPSELFALMRRIRAAGLELMGIYHSHPKGRNEPSRTDVEQAYYPDVAYFILSPLEGCAWPVRAFSIADGNAAELRIREV